MTDPQAEEAAPGIRVVVDRDPAKPVEGVRVVEYAPMVLPEDWTEDRLDEHGIGRLWSLAIRRGLHVVSEPRRVSEEGLVDVNGEWVPVGPIINGVCAVVPRGDLDPRIRDLPKIVAQARLVAWEADGQSHRVDAVDGFSAQAEPVDEDTWAADVQPSPILSIRHGLDTQSVRVRAYAGGRRVGMVGCMVISGSEIEVVPAPGTTRVVIERDPEDEDDEDADTSPDA